MGRLLRKQGRLAEAQLKGHCNTTCGCQLCLVLPPGNTLYKARSLPTWQVQNWLLVQPRCYRRGGGSTILPPLFLSLIRNRWLPAKSNPFCYRIKLTLFIFNWASLQINAEKGTISWVDLQQKENKQCLTCAVRYQVSQSSYIWLFWHNANKLSLTSLSRFNDITCDISFECFWNVFPQDNVSLF